MSRLRAVAALVAAALAVVLAASPTVHAHATLQATVPERGAQLAQVPSGVEMRFNEPVEIAFGAVRVFDADGDEVQAGAPFHPRDDSRVVGIRVRDGAGVGGYTVTYRVVSADAHPIEGGFVFGVGSGVQVPTRSVADLLAGQDSGPVTAVAFSLVRALEYAAIAFGIGVLALLYLVWLPAVRAAGTAEAAWTDASRAVADRARRMVVVTAAVGALAALTALPLQAANAAGTDFFTALGDLGTVLETRFGVVWGLGAAVWVLAGGLWASGAQTAVPVLRPATMGATGTALPRPGPLAWLLAAPLLALAVLPGLGGHAGVQAPIAVLLPANVVHVLAAGAWIGGIAAVLACLPAGTRAFAAERRSAVLGAVLLRFSTVALAAVVALLAGGILQSLFELSAVDDLLDTAFGRAILVKAALVVTLLAVGAWHRRRGLPALARAAEAGGRGTGAAGIAVRRGLRVEVLLGIAALIATGALAGYPPGTAQTTGPFTGEAVLGPAEATLTVEPALVGANELHLYLFRRTDGSQYDGVRELTIEAALPEAGIPGVPLPARKAGPGHYVLSAASLSPGGDWEVDVVARVSEFDEHRATFTVPVR